MICGKPETAGRVQIRIVCLEECHKGVAKSVVLRGLPK